MGDEKAVEKFDPSQLMQGVKDRIKSTFVSLIPDGHWEQMVKIEIDRFTKETNDRYGNITKSEFAKIVDGELNKILREKIRSELEKFVGSNWDNKITPELEKLIKENAGDLIAGMMGSMLQQAI